MTPPQNVINLIESGRCHNSPGLATDSSASKARYFSIKTGLASASAGSDQASHNAQKLATFRSKMALLQPPLDSSEASKNAQKLRIGGPGAAHVEVLDAEVRTLHIVQPNPPSQGQALNRSISNRAAKPSVL